MVVSVPEALMIRVNPYRAKMSRAGLAVAGARGGFFEFGTVYFQAVTGGWHNRFSPKICPAARGDLEKYARQFAIRTLFQRLIPLSTGFP
jgi:hypothetical protein